MKRSTLLTVTVLGCLIAAAATFGAGSMAPGAARKTFAAYGERTPRNVTGRLFRDCIDLPVECGLVVW